MVPEPLPDLPLGRDNHPALVFTVHEQFAWVVSDAVTLPPGMHGAKVTGATDIHSTAPAYLPPLA